MPVRVPGSESSAPHLTSDSIAFLFTARQSTRRQKSQIELNGPPSSRAATIASTACVADVLDRVEAEADVALARP